MDFESYNISESQLKEIYKALLTPRLIEEKMLILLRQGKVGKWFSGIGQEAIAVGATLALYDDEYIFPLHRNLGVFTTRKIPFAKLLSQWQGKKSGFTKGRDRSFHFGTHQYHIVGMISHLGAMNGVACGVALSEKLSNSGKCTLIFNGDGGASEGDFHEALNLAAVWELPLIFLIENNGYGLSTPSHEQFRHLSFADKGPAYGIEAVSIDGNNILEVFTTINNIANQIRTNPRPYIVECKTFRMRGHEEASGVKYVPKHFFEEWKIKDPLHNFEKYILEKSIIDNNGIDEINSEILKEIEEGIEKVFSEPDIIADIDEELADVYKKYEFNEVLCNKEIKTEKRFIDAISDGLKQSMKHHPSLVLMGQDIAAYGGVFKITDGFVEKFGKHRVRNTPICESAVIGAAYGYSIRGKKAMVEMQFADFISCGFNQVVNNLAKSHYRWAQNADVVIRMPTGAGTGAGPFHSQSNEAWFFKTPGLKIVYPSTPYSAKGLLCEAFNDPNPVLFFEHKYLYRNIKETIPDEYYNLPIGKANVVKTGELMTIIAYGWAVHWAAQIIENENIYAELIDLQTLLPWDKETVEKSVKKTGKVLIVHEDTITGGIAAEISAWIGSNCFEYLDAPVIRVGSLDTPIPMAQDLEDNFLAKKYLKTNIYNLLSY
ncbi:MAG: dehydrogenase [Bacteroidetes bacterium]|nr:dehydrogenase [Bacteroidota bacterium]